MMNSLCSIALQVILSAQIILSCASLKEEPSISHDKKSPELKDRSPETILPVSEPVHDIEYILPTYYISARNSRDMPGTLTLALVIDSKELSSEIFLKIDLISLEINRHFASLKFSEMDTEREIEAQTEPLLLKINHLLTEGKVKKIKIVDIIIQ